jgi:hypothetical protein
MRAPARFAALLVALAAWIGLAIQYVATARGLKGDVGATLWTLLGFFTIWTNLGVALIFSALALGARRARSPLLLGGITLSILLVGIIYGLLLAGLRHLSGGAAMADLLLHKVTPLLVPLWWLAFAPRGELGRTAPWAWALFPGLYLPYALLRGRAEDHYAYPFIDVSKLGLARVLLNALLIGLGFVLAGHSLLWLERRRR